MRLHHLQVTAFGPFAETVEVDFDDLSGAGLFLLSGPTGAGKTSVLDAVCFALYGDVPGDRNAAKRFRCDLADPSLAPRVVLETTLSGRRFRLTRSPAWSRPKKRGRGLTTEHASVLLEERIEGEWVPQTTRLDEAGHLVSNLLGMTMPQFCQVAMLPQGRFQAFLRARSEDRHRLLQQLFSTHRFEDIERWLRDRARSLHRESQSLQRETARVVSRLLEAAEQPMPEEWSLEDLTPQFETGELRRWADSLRNDARTEAAETTSARERAVRSERSAREARDAGHRVAALQDRAAQATATLHALTSDEGQHRQRLDRLRAARRAAPVAPLHRLSEQGARRQRAAEQAVAVALAEVEALTGLTSPSPEQVEQALDELRGKQAHASRARSQALQLHDLTRSITETQERLHQLVEAETRAREEVASIPLQVEELTSRLGLARDAASEASRLTEECERLESALCATERAETLRANLAEATEERHRVVDECQRLKEEWLALTEARIRGMAAELATDLAVGASCPVCGSADHPHKAEPVQGAPSAAGEKSARKALDDAEAVRTAVEGRVHDLTSSLRLAEHEAGPDGKDVLTARLGTARESLANASALAAEAGKLQAAMVIAQRSLEAATQTLAEAKVQLARHRTNLDHTRLRVAEIEAELETLLADTGHEDLDSLLDHQQRCISASQEALRREAERQAASQEAQRARSALQAWLDDHDFADLDGALAAVLSDEELQSLEHRITGHEQQRAAAAAVLDDPDVTAVLNSVAPDLAALDTAAEHAGQELTATRSAADLAQLRSTRLEALAHELDAALQRWRPVLDATVTATELASFVEGKSAENDLRMRLSAYVLAWRLTQVVAAGNERLVQMSDRRYTLEHTDRRGAGETRGGLSLQVLDEWSGEHRDPATLSGGETFVVSLALALGLADVVAHEAGGAELDTLFVDEGFGTLDSETLDDVMDTLDALRDGGRVVGVVSHVAEMRSRIPTQLVVAKHRSRGSSLSVIRDAV